MIYRRGNKPFRQSVPVVYMRGGSSKALVFHESDIPPPGIERDNLLKRVMGTPDPLQIDGMGGTRAVTSKIAIISPSNRPDADVDYLFAQVGINDDAVGYTGNCGNISAAVGPFAIEEGLIEEFREGATIGDNVRTQLVRIYNVNTDKVIISHVAIDDAGAPLEKGSFEMSAVPGTGAPILMDYADTIGARMGKGVLPSGNLIDKIHMDGKEIELTICDVANPIVFFKAEDIGMTGYEKAQDLSNDLDLQTRMDELRGRAAQLVGLCDDWRKVDEQSPYLPMPVALARCANDQGHIEARLFLDHMCHDSMAGSGAICMAACSRVPGTIVAKLLKDKALNEQTLQISHPAGLMPVLVKTKATRKSDIGVPEYETLSFIRTARRIMEGNLLLPED